MLTLGLPGPAVAAGYGTDDPTDTYHGSDITHLQVKNGDENLRVTTDHQNLRPDPATGSGGLVFIDTDEADRGPEYVLAAGYFRGTDYVLSATEGFARKKWGAPVEHGDYLMKVDYAEDRVRVVLSRHALGDPSEVRVAVRASGTRTDGTTHDLVDWVGEPRSFTPWIAQG